ncbi:MAG: HAMP domain-containing protein [Deltaproteobacteria bacterium]|nr:HAMP domain-containing protein [Candidatus Zymogenaceae bacterium]
MKNKLFIRVFLGYFIVTVFLTILIFVTSLQALQYYYQNKLSSSTSDLCVTIGRLVSPSMNVDTADVKRIIKETNFEPQKRVAIFDAYGNVLADTGPDPSIFASITSKREFINALNGVVGTYSDIDDSGKNDILLATAPILKDGNAVGVVMIRLPAETGIDSIPPILFIAVCVFVLFFAILGAAIFSSHLSNPIQELSNAAKRVSEGDFSARVFLDRNDEIKQLADRFNIMTERIDFLFRQVLQQKDELLQIISCLDEGLVVVDKDDRIILFNESFGSIAHESPVAGRFYWEALRDLRVSELVSGTRKDKQGRHEQMEINNRAYNCSVIHIPSKDEIVIVLHDITDIKDLEQMKKEFVSNVSHELRTPLTAIKGFIDAIEETGQEKSSHYLQIIKRNTDRMISIIKDLLLICEFEQESIGIHAEDIDVEEMVRGILAMFEKPINDKGLTASVIVQNGPIIISADSFKIEQLFVNLIDNAVKYTQRGGITIRLSMTDHLFTARVEDTGVGISKDDIPHIFERFYRVDKSRSRSLGGTGLGLSIVKYVVLLQNGDIKVESTEGVGTTFTVTIPRGKSGSPRGLSVPGNR